MKTLISIGIGILAGAAFAWGLKQVAPTIHARIY